MVADILPENIKKIRTEMAHMSQQAFADMLGKKLSIVQKYEGGSIFPPPDVLDKLSELYNIEWRQSHKRRHPALKSEKSMPV